MGPASGTPNVLAFPGHRPPAQVGFDRFELTRILDLYGRMVAAQGRERIHHQAEALFAIEVDALDVVATHAGGTLGKERAGDVAAQACAAGPPDRRLPPV